MNVVAERPRIRPLFWRLTERAGRAVAMIRLRLQVRLEGAVPEGAVLLCSKHTSSLDISLLATNVRRLRGAPPYFQMGSFVGYPLLGVLRPVLRALGGFSVMRPKEVRQLSKRRGWDRESATQMMRDTNVAADRVRQDVLGSGGVLIVFPEGTRDDSELRPLKSEREVLSGIEAARDGVAVRIWPVTIALGPPRWWRRPAVIRFHEPLELDPTASAIGVLEQIEARLEAGWVPPAEVATA
ncbi:MAG: hypothetical protein CMJ83_09225 [Planctomycetes bacterium]|nr:hypothetical protein [Planctomycetota bacterium]